MPESRWEKEKGLPLHNTKNELYRPLRCMQRHCRQSDFISANGRFRSLSGHDYGRKSGGKYTRRPFQPLCCSGKKLSQRYLYAFRPDLRVPLCRELWSSAEQQQNYLPRCTGRFGSLYYACFRSLKNHYFRIKANKNWTKTVNQPDTTLTSRRPIRPEYTPDIHYRLAKRLEKIDGKPIAEYFSQSQTIESRLG